MTINPTAVWRVRPSGSNTNGGGFDAGISGAGTDYSQQNAAQASGTHGTASGTTTFSDTTAAAFTAAMVGNAIYITGTGFTTGWYFITARASTTSITLDRSPGTGTTATWHIGGAWADFVTNTTSSGPLVPGNTVYILGAGGTPNPASYVYDYHTTTYFTNASGDQTNGAMKFFADPNTPAPGYPVIQCDSELFYQSAFTQWQNLWFVANGTTGAVNGIISAGARSVAMGCIYDQFGYDMPFSGNNQNNISISNCELTSSVSPRTGSSLPVFACQAYGSSVFGCNIHDCVAGGLLAQYMASVSFNVISKNGGTGIVVQVGAAAVTYGLTIFNNTVDGNLGNAIEIADQATASQCSIFNNIISNHTASGKVGFKVDAGTAAANDRLKSLIDFNTFYNNTTNYSGISAGANDTQLVSSPYVNESADNWTLNSANFATGTTPAAALPQRITGWNG